jgi:hypothetical protein
MLAVSVTTLLLDNQFLLDYRLVSKPSFQSQFFDTYHQVRT